MRRAAGVQFPAGESDFLYYTASRPAWQHCERVKTGRKIGEKLVETVS
jgi:hypothetical protein